jgi:hypothetical protein
MRFYKPRLREYVSTQVDMPWEFLQGVAEQKQKGFDTAMLAGDAAANLLNFNVIPGDQQYKQEKQKQYNDQIYKVRDYLMQTGDFNSAARNLSNITRQIVQDQDLAIMKAAVAPYEKDRDAWEKMKQEGKLLNQWQSNFKLDYSTKDPTTERHKSYNQLVGYETPNYHAAATNSFGKLQLSTDEKGRTYFLDSQGIKRDVTIGGGSILKQDIINRAETALPAYRNTDAYYDHKVRASWELNNNLNPDLKKLAEEKGENEAIISRADELARQNMISTNLDQVRSQTKDIIRDDLYSEEDRKARGLVPPPAPPIQDPSVQIEGKKFDLSKTYLEAIGMETGIGTGIQIGNTKTKIREYVNPWDLQKEGKMTSDEWHGMGHYLMKTNKPLWKKIFEYKTASNDELKLGYESFGDYYNKVNKGIASNTVVRAITDPKDVHALYLSKPALEVSLEDLINAPGIGADKVIYNTKSDEFTTLGQLYKDVKDKKVKVNFNKEVTPYNAITQNAKDKKQNNPDQFSTGFGFTLEGADDFSYIIPKPKEYRTVNDVLLNKLNSVTFFPGKVEELTIPSKKGNIKVYATYEPGMDYNAFAQAREQGQPVGGRIAVYKTKEAAQKGSLNPDDAYVLPPLDPTNLVYSDPFNVLNNLLLNLPD